MATSLAAAPLTDLHQLLHTPALTMSVSYPRHHQSACQIPEAGHSMASTRRKRTIAPTVGPHHQNHTAALSISPVTTVSIDPALPAGHQLSTTPLMTHSIEPAEPALPTDEPLFTTTQVLTLSTEPLEPTEAAADLYLPRYVL